MLSQQQIQARIGILSGDPDPFFQLALPQNEQFHVIGDLETTARRILHLHTGITLCSTKLSRKITPNHHSLTPQQSLHLVELLVEHAHSLYLENERCQASLKAIQSTRSALHRALTHQGCRLTEDAVDIIASDFVAQYLRGKNN